MKLSKFSILSVFMFLFIFSSSSHVFGADEPTDIKMEQSHLVGTVGIENARIISQDKGTFNIAFSISNKEILQTGVKYGVQLIPEGSKYIADEKVYEESITLYENTLLNSEVTYTAPSFLNGSYNIYLLSRSENNFPFGIVPLGKVKLSATSKGIKIANESCYLQVEGEKGSPRYNLTQNVDISSSEQLKLTCNAVNEGSKEVSVTPSYETRYNGSFGKIAPQAGGDFLPIKFAKGEKKTFSLLLPKGTTAQFYSLKFALMDKNVSSNNIYAGYIVRGLRASVQKVSLDKDYYKAGDTGEMSVLWEFSSGNFARSDTKNNILPEVNLNSVISNERGQECVSPIKQILTEDSAGPETKISFKIKSTCLNPKVITTLSDGEGNMLDKKDFSFKSSVENSSNPINPLPMTILVIVLIVSIGVGVYMKNRNSGGINKQ